MGTRTESLAVDRGPVCHPIACISHAFSRKILNDCINHYVKSGKIYEIDRGKTIFSTRKKKERKKKKK